MYTTTTAQRHEMHADDQAPAAMNTILIASGSLSTRIDLEDALTAENLVFVTVTTRLQAQRAIERDAISLVILDPELHDSNGVHFYHDLRRNPRTRNTMVMLLCAEDELHLSDNDEFAQFAGKRYDRTRIVEQARRYGHRLNGHANDGPGTRVLLVDPDHDYVHRTASQLHREDFDVSCAETLEQAERLLFQERYEAIIIDLTSELFRGRDLRRWIRSTTQRSDIMVLALVADENPDNLSVVLRAGADDYVARSSGFEGLRARLRTSLQRFSAERETRRMREALLIKAMQATEADRARRNAESRATLLAELQTKNAQLEQARRAAESAADAKSTFLASMSHEIRTPLNAIIGVTELLRDAELLREHAELIEVVRTSSNHLLSTINHILDFSKLEAGKMDLLLTDTDLREVVEESIEITAVQASHKRLDLSYTMDALVPAYILADAGRLRQVLVNLLSNGVKFTEKGGVHVHISSRALADEHCELTVAVRDTGIGISPDQVSQLFKAFSQLNSQPSSRPPGTGLGLAISSGLVSLMQGTFDVDSSPGKGATFSFTIPVTVTRYDEPMLAKSQMLRGLQVLYISEANAARDMLKNFVEIWGGTFLHVADVKKAETLLTESGDINIAIVDDSIVGATARKLAARVHRPAGAPPVQWLLAGGIDSAASLTGEFSAFVTKPLRMRALYTVFSRLVQDLPNAASSSKAGRRRRGIVPNTAFFERRLPRAATRILIAEDNPTSAKVAGMLLGSLGYAFELASNGLEAVEKATSGHFDVVLMDLEMPRLDGLGATRRIRAALGEARPPYIIALTAAATAEDREDCIIAGMDHYITKPVTRDHLRRAIERAALPSPTAPSSSEMDSSGRMPDEGLTPSMAQLRAQLGEEALMSLISTFARDAESMTQRIEGALADRDPLALRKAAHSLKSGSGYLGLAKLSLACQALEEACKGANGFNEAWVPEVENALHLSRESLEQLQTILNRHSNPED